MKYNVNGRSREYRPTGKGDEHDGIGSACHRRFSLGADPSMRSKKMKGTIYSGNIQITFFGDLNKIQDTAHKFIGKANVDVSADYETQYFCGQPIRLGGHTGSAGINLTMISGKAVEKIIKILLDEVEKKTSRRGE